MSLLDFSPRIPLGTFSILLCIDIIQQINVKYVDQDHVEGDNEKASEEIICEKEIDDTKEEYTSEYH